MRGVLSSPEPMVAAGDGSGDRTLPRWPSVALFAAAAAAAATALPLLTYSLSLAAFGLAHVAVELRYVRRRFGPRLDAPVRTRILALLAVVVLGRSAVVGRLWSPSLWGPLELLVGGALVLAVVPGLRARPAALGGGVLIAALALGATVAPVPTLLVLAVVHNTTPAGFLAERLQGRMRRGVLAASGALLGVAILIATGLPTSQLATLGWWRPEYSLLSSAGPLHLHLGQYVSTAWAGDRAVPLFSAAVFLQCVHYGAVLGVLPRLDPGEPAQPPSADARPEGFQPFPTTVVAMSLTALGGFMISFSGARSVYSLAAAVHAWVEIPLLLVALSPRESTHLPGHAS